MKQFLEAKDVAELCGVSLSTAYKIIRNLNDELSGKGFLTIAGKVPAAFLNDKLYGGIIDGGKR